MRKQSMKMMAMILAAGLAFSSAWADDNLPTLGSDSHTPSAAAAAQLKQAPIADLAEAKKARSALDELIRAYETGNIAFIQSRLSPSMIGYQRFLDGVGRDSNLMKQIRIHLFDTQVTAGPDVAMIQTGWEKRFISVASFAPELYSGRSLFLLHRDQGEWKIANMSGDNLFASQSGVLGKITLSAPSIPGPCPCATILTVTLLDPDMAGQGSAIVEVLSTQGERETLTLIETTPGRFTNTAVDFDIAGGFVPGNGVVEGTAGSRILFTFRSLDRTPGSNRPPSYVLKTLRVGP